MLQKRQPETQVFPRPPFRFFPKNVKGSVKVRQELRKKIEELAKRASARHLGVQRNKFPPMFFIPTFDNFNAQLYDELITALVCRNVAEFKKRFPSLPAMVITASPSFPRELLQHCTFGIMPLRKVWFLTWKNQKKKKSVLPLENGCEYIMFRALRSGYDVPPISEARALQTAVVHDYKQALNNQNEGDMETIAELSQAAAAVLVHHNAHHANDVDPEFLNICQLLQAMHSETSPQHQSHQSSNQASRNVPCVYIVACDEEPGHARRGAAAVPPPPAPPSALEASAPASESGWWNTHWHLKAAPTCCFHTTPTCMRNRGLPTTPPASSIF